MEEVILSCLECGVELGRFNNSWDGIGNTYYSPTHPSISLFNGFEPSGDVHRGTEGTRVRDCFLQDLSCRNCSAILGVRCDSAPEGHLLKKNQLILGLKLMHVVSKRTGQSVTPSVQQRFSLTLPGAPKSSNGRRASTAQPTPRTQTPSLSSEGNKPKSITGTMLPPIDGNKKNSVNNTLQLSAGESPQRDTSKFVRWAEKAIKSQQNDIDRIGGAVDRIERDMKSFKDFMLETRTEAAASRQGGQNLYQEDLVRLRTATIKLKQESRRFEQQLADSDLDLIRKEQNDLRRESHQFQQRLEEGVLALVHRDISELKQDSREFRLDLEEADLANSRDLDQLRRDADSNKKQLEEFLGNDHLQVSIGKSEGLRDDVHKIHRKANEVDGLKVELQRLQDRIRIMEEKTCESFEPRESHVNTLQAPVRSLLEGARRESMSLTELSQQQYQAKSDAPNVLAAGTVKRNPTSQSQSQKETVLVSEVENKLPRPGLNTKNREEGDSRSQISSKGPGFVVGSAGPTDIAKWYYTGSSHGNRLQDVFKSFGIPYQNLAGFENVKILEDHVNNSQIQNLVLAQKHGQVVIELDNNEEIENQKFQEPEPEPPLPKRKHDRVGDEDTDGQLKSGIPSKKIRQSDQHQGRAADSGFPSSNLPSHSALQDSHTIISSDQGSPELGEDSVLFQSHPDNEELSPYLSLKTSTISRIKKSAAGPRRVSLPELGHKNAQPTSSPKPRLNPAKHSERRHSGPVPPYKNTDFPATPAGKIATHSLRVKRMVSNHENAGPTSTPRQTARNGTILPSIETEAAAAHAARMYTAHAQTPGIGDDEEDIDELAGNTPQQPSDDPTSTTKRHRCGECGAAYKYMQGLNRHKGRSTACKKAVNNEIPSELNCVSCGKSFKSQYGLDYHYIHSAPCQDPDLVRKKTLALREELVRQTLEREMGG